jgi:SAM-dependent methyltransferase
MQDAPRKTTATSEEVLHYYARNWAAIVGCYDLRDDGLPVDPAWYRRRLYREMLERRRPAAVLDVGCGGGRTVLDALELGLDATGIEPVIELKNAAAELLRRHGHDPARIRQDDLAGVADYPSASQDCVALLSVLPHVPAPSWDDVHRGIARLLRPGGCYVAAYRNTLFDLFTFNSYTVEFYDRTLWEGVPSGASDDRRLEKLKSLITHPDVPGPYHTNAADKSFGQLSREKSNPLTMPAYLREFGLRTERTRFYHFHCVPPLAQDAVKDFRASSHDLDLTLSDDWRGHFMAAMFVVEAVRQ